MTSGDRDNDHDDHDNGDFITSRIFLIRHGDRYDYANPSWLEEAKTNGALITDPPLSELGHQQARETARYLRDVVKLTGRTAVNGVINAVAADDDEKNNDEQQQQELTSTRSVPIDRILVSPYLRVIQTSVPTAEILGVPVKIETGLSEAHATPNMLPTSKQRFAYFPHIDTTYQSKVSIKATSTSSSTSTSPNQTTTFVCPKTQLPCEAFAGDYVKRIEKFAALLENEQEYEGKNIVLFSHAASVALVAALLRTSIRSLKFAPCGIYHLERQRRRSRNSNSTISSSSTTTTMSCWSPWKLVRNGDSNTDYVMTNSPSTYPWGFSERHFMESTEEEKEGSSKTGGSGGGGGGDFMGQSIGVDMDYFVPK